MGSSVFQQVLSSVLASVGAVDAGWDHNLELKNDGTVMAWGLNGWGQLGLGSNSGADTPQQIPSRSLSGVVAVAMGQYHSLALKSNGTVLVWGSHSDGQLGLGNAWIPHTPTPVPSSLGMLLSGSTTVALGTPWVLSLDRVYAGAPHVYVLDVSFAGSALGIVVPCWGTLPLNPPFLNMEYGTLFPGVFHNFIGTIAAGQVLQASVNLAPYPPRNGLSATDPKPRRFRRGS
ncbi:MAG: hypothetical protein EXS14_09645 [Planctomycetes bacterium]|nr:hypothetical protein [Planctomycetota bacterium]